MFDQIKFWLRSASVARSLVMAYVLRPLVAPWFLRSLLSSDERTHILKMPDPVRFGSLLLALQDIEKSAIPGSIAECGVYKGKTSNFIHKTLPRRRLYLFDTFEGFDTRDLEGENDQRFKDVDLRRVLAFFGNDENVIVKKGYFPDTVRGIEDEQFSFVLIDFDKYEPTLAALEFFYPRLSKGGYVFVHDYNSPESDWACSRALTKFLSDKQEKPIGIPDSWGSAVFRKL